MNINMEFIKSEIENQFKDKMGNMCSSEISEELYEFLKDKKETVCQNVYGILSNNEYVNAEKALDGFTNDLIMDWELIDEYQGEEREKEIQSTILYNYDALWMAAIHKAFPNNTTNTQCGYGEMKLIK